MDCETKGFIPNTFNYIFVGEAGSGKSEIAINFAKYLAERREKPVHFFDMDMTKPLFRSRDIKGEIEGFGVQFHHEEQFFDAPTLVGGVRTYLKAEDCYTVLDVGGNDIGARAIGGFAPLINAPQSHTAVYYVLNPYRPWSDDLPHIDGTLSAILKTSHIHLEKIHLISNPNHGVTTTAEEVLGGNEKLRELIGPYMNIEFTCVSDSLYPAVRNLGDTKWMPIHLYLTYPWL